MERNLLRVFIFLFSILCLFSCGNKGSYSLENEQTEDEINRSLACAQVNFLDGILAHQNMNHLFHCVKTSGVDGDELLWKDKFPSLLAAINQVSKEHWNHLFGPIEEHFFRSRARRDRFFGQIKKLNEKGALDDLSEVINSLMVSNLYDAFYEVLDNAKKNPINLLHKRDVLELIKLLEVNPSIIKDIIFIFKELNQRVNQYSYCEDGNCEDGVGYKESVLELINNKAFKFFRKDLITAIFEAFEEIHTKIEIKAGNQDFFYNLFAARLSDGKTFWRSWFTSDLYKDKLYEKVVKFPLVENKSFFDELDIFHKIYKSKLSCRLGENDEFEVISPFEHQFDGYVQELMNSDITSFFEYVFNQNEKIHIVTNYCDWGGVNYRWSYVDFIAYQNSKMKLFEEPHIFNFFQNITKLANSSLNKNNQTESGDLTEFLFKIYNSNFLKKFNYLNKIGLTQDYPFYKVMERIFAGVEKNGHQVSAPLQDEFYESLGRVFHFLLSDEYSHRVFLVSKLWRALDKEQDILLNVLDVHFTDNAKYSDLFNFYEELNVDFYRVIPKLNAAYVGDDSKLDLTFDAFVDFTDKYRGEAVLKDLRKFFSRSEIIKTIEVIARESDYTSDIGPASKVQTYKLPDTLVIDDSSNDPQQVEELKLVIGHIKSCSNALGKEKFYKYIMQLPAECEGLKIKRFTGNIAFWLNAIEKDYESIFKVTLLDDKGLLGVDTLKLLLLTNLAVRDKTDIPGDLPGNNVANLLDSIKKFLFVTQYNESEKAGTLPILSDILASLKRLVDLDNKELKTKEFIRVIIKQMLSDQDWLIGEDLFQIFKGYAKWEHTTPVFDEKSSCHDLENASGISPCPDKTTIKRSYKKMLDLAFRKNDKDRENFFYYFLAGLYPDIGTKIPFNSETDQYVMNLEDAFLYFYDVGDSKYSKDYIFYKDKNEIQLSGNIAERLEVILRNIAFKKNRLGAFWQNNVGRGKDSEDDNGKRVSGYLKETKKMQKTFKSCVDTWICRKFLGSENTPAAKNAVSAYWALYEHGDVFEHELLGKRQYDKMVSALLTQILKSSAKKSVRDDLLFFLSGKKSYVKHNGLILTEFANLSLVRNTARVLRDRFGHSEEEIYSIITSPVFISINKNLSNKFKFENLYNFLNELYTHNKRDIHVFVDDIVDWYLSLNYQEQRLLEHTGVNLAYLFSKIDVKTCCSDQEDFTYILAPVQTMLENWVSFKEGFEAGGNKLSTIIEPLYTITTFFKEKLVTENNADDGLYYVLLNKVMRGITHLFYSEKIDTDLPIQVVVKVLTKDSGAAINIVKSLYKITNRLHYKESDPTVLDPERLEIIASNLVNFSKTGIGYELAIRNYFHSLVDTSSVHYDEQFKLLEYLNMPLEKVADSRTRFENLFQVLFIENYEMMKNEMIDVFDPKMLIMRSSP